jgi:hypothetical protein
LRCHPESALSLALPLGSGRGLFDANRHTALRAAALDRELDLVADP